MQQEEPVGGGWTGSCEIRLRGGEKLVQLLLGPSSSGHIHHRPDEIANHMVEIPVSTDLEAISNVPPTGPNGASHAAALSAFRLARFGEFAKGTLAWDQVCGRGKHLRVELGVGEVPAPPAVERGSRRLLHAESVFVGSRDRVKTRMEVRRNPSDLIQPDLWRQQGVHRLAKLCGRPLRGHIDGRDLPQRVHAAVRASGSHNGAAFSGDLLEPSFQLTLYGRSRILELPPLERRAIVLDDQAVPSELPGDHAGKGK